MTVNSTEFVLSSKPFVVRRCVKWGECDPAGVVYTAQFSEYVLSAVELFYAHLLGSAPETAKRLSGIHTPTRALEFDFRKTLAPDDVFDMAVSVRRVRTRSYSLGIEATCDGALTFSALITPVCTDRDTLRAVAIPAALKNALAHWS
jgi:acyl-CoA thioesterase FadM